MKNLRRPAVMGDLIGIEIITLRKNTPNSHMHGRSDLET
jgi:hypothetical protein